MIDLSVFFDNFFHILIIAIAKKCLELTTAQQFDGHGLCDRLDVECPGSKFHKRFSSPHSSIRRSKHGSCHDWHVISTTGNFSKFTKNLFLDGFQKLSKNGFLGDFFKICPKIYFWATCSKLSQKVSFFSSIQPFYWTLPHMELQTTSQTSTIWSITTSTAPTLHWCTMISRCLRLPTTYPAPYQSIPSIMATV